PLLRRGGERHVRAIGLRRYAPPRGLRARRRRALGYGAVHGHAVRDRRHQAEGGAEPWRHLRRRARAPVRAAQQRHLHDRRVGHDGVEERRDRAHRHQSFGYEIPPQRAQFRLRFPQPVTTDAGAGAPLHGRRAARDLRDARDQLRRYVMRAFFVLAATSGALLLSCVGTTGGAVIDFPAAAAGPSDAVAGQPFVIDTYEGWHVVLTKALLLVGGVYLDESEPVSGVGDTACVLPGTYVAQVTSGMKVDLLSPTPVLFPAPAHGITGIARVAQVWLTGGDVNAVD